MPVRLYWADGRVEDLKRPLDVTEHDEIIRNSDGRHIHSVFSGNLDADGFAIYEEELDRDGR